MLNQLQARRQVRMQEEPATDKQRWFLTRRGLWRDSMSKGEARQAIIAWKAEEASPTAVRQPEAP